MGLASIPRVAIPALAFALAFAPARVKADPWRPWATQESWGPRIQHPDPAVRRAALWALSLRDLPRGGAAGARLVTQVAAVAQRDRDPGAAAAAVFVLAQAGSAEARAALRELAGAPGAPVAVRAGALRAYSLTGDVAAASGLLTASRAGTLPLEGDALVAVAERTLADLPDAAFGAQVRAANPAVGTSAGRAGVLRAIGLRGDPRWAPALADALRVTRRNSAGLTALAALDAVARLRLAELAEPVVALARGDGDPAVRRAAVRTLGALGGAFDPAVVRALLDEPATREPALEALGSLGDAGSIAAVAALLDAPWAGDRRAAAEALAAIGSPAAVAPLAARAEREDDVDVRRALWRAIARVGGGDARDALARADDPAARWALAELLAREPSLHAPSGVGGEDASGLALAALAGAPRADALASPSAGRRAAAALALGLAPSADVARVDALGGALARESHEGARVALVLALADVAGHEGASRAARGAASGLLLGLVEREGDAPSLAGVAALSSLGSLRVAAARPAAARAVAAGHASALVRRVALRAAGQLGARGARWVAARALVSDPDAGVRGAAAVALRALLGGEAEPYLRAASLASGSPELIDRIAGAAGAVGFRGGASVRASGAEPGSVWALALPDGGVAFGVAADDGELWVRGAPEAGEGELARAELQ